MTFTPTLKPVLKRHTYSTGFIEMSAVFSPSTVNEKAPGKPGSAIKTKAGNHVGGQLLRSGLQGRCRSCNPRLMAPAPAEEF